MTDVSPGTDPEVPPTRHSDVPVAPPPTNAAGRVFVSHSSRDAAVASRFVDALEAAGVACWVAPRDIAAGSEYNAAIMAGLSGARALLLVYSRHSVASDPVAREVERALNRRVPVIPVRLEQVPPSPALEYMISTAQWVDAFPPPTERHLERVVAAVSAALGVSAGPDAHSRHGDATGPAGPTYVGPYRILEPLGEGGMGAVFKAEQRSPVRRVVALKRIKAGFDSAEVVARFEAERQALARMDHPNVAKVLDAGADERGRPYFVMEYVPGLPITQFADERKLTVRQRLALFAQACDAIAHAHTKALIHRDIKPGNVLAYLADGGPAVKVIDFGIAKALTGDRLTDRTLNTSAGQAIGTFEAMSPEQADGSPDVDTRTDVYSLGVLLYELLAGEKPFDRAALATAGQEEARRVIREVDPPRPSTRLSALAADAGTEAAAARRSQVAGLARELRSELEWIPLKAMRKERERRYASAAELAADCRRYLAGEPLLAGPESRLYRARKFARRHRGALVAAAAVVLLAVGGTVAYVRGIAAEQRKTEAALVEANAQRAAALASRAEADQDAAIARGQRALALATLDKLVFDVQEKLDKPSLLQVRRSVLEIALAGLKKIERSAVDAAARADRGTAVARGRIGDILVLLGRTTDARDAYAAGVGLLEALVAADPANLDARRELSVAANKLADASVQLGEVKAAKGQYERALAAREAIAAARPADAEAKRDLSVSHNRLGDVCFQMGDVAAAKTHYELSLVTSEALAKADPASAEAKRDLSFVHDRLGTLALRQRDAPAARRHYEQSLAADEALAAADPGNAEAQRDLSVSHDKVGNLLVQSGEPKSAKDHYERSLKIRESLSAADPANVVARRDVSISYEKLGDVSLGLGDAAAAKARHEQALAVRVALAAADPANVGAQSDVVVSYSKIGVAAGLAKQPAEATAAYRRGLDLLRELESAGKLKDQPALRGWIPLLEKQLAATRPAGL